MLSRKRRASVADGDSTNHPPQVDHLDKVKSGAESIGAQAVGTQAIGALAIGRLKIGKAHIRRLEIDELVVRRLQILEPSPVPPNHNADS